MVKCVNSSQLLTSQFIYRIVLVAASQGKRFPPYYREAKGKYVEKGERKQSKTWEAQNWGRWNGQSYIGSRLVFVSSNTYFKSQCFDELAWSTAVKEVVLVNTVSGSQDCDIICIGRQGCRWKSKTCLAACPILKYGHCPWGYLPSQHAAVIVPPLSSG